MKALRIMIALALFLSMISAAVALPATIDEVEIDDTILSANSVNRLALERGEEYEVRVRFTPIQDIDNAQIRVFVSGYEFSDDEDIEDKTTIFDAEANVTYSKKLSILIPDDADEDDYKLRVIVTDRFGDELAQNYNLKFDLARNAVSVEDVIFNPANAVKAGSALLTTVRVENKGEKAQDDVKVTVNVAGLGLSGTEYIDELDDGDDQEETEEIFLRIPHCAKAGTYDVIIDVEFSQNHRKITEKRTINVLADETCEENTQVKSAITLGSSMQNVEGGNNAVFPITITNAGKTSKSYSVTVPSADFAQISITPSSLVVVPAGQTQTVFVNAAINENTPNGAHSLTAYVDSDGSRSELTLTAQVTGNASRSQSVFEVILIVLIVILVILGIVVGFVHFRGKEQTEAYY